ncbi:MAG: hypothetical protein AAGK14_00795 [Verrucomicrobiota bacterium]
MENTPSGSQVKGQEYGKEFDAYWSDVQSGAWDSQSRSRNVEDRRLTPTVLLFLLILFIVFLPLLLWELAKGGYRRIRLMDKQWEDFAPTRDQIEAAKEFARYFEASGKLEALVELTAKDPDAALEHFPYGRMSDYDHRLEQNERILFARWPAEKAFFLYRERQMLKQIVDAFLAQIETAKDFEMFLMVRSDDELDDFAESFKERFQQPVDWTSFYEFTNHYKARANELAEDSDYERNFDSCLDEYKRKVAEDLEQQGFCLVALSNGLTIVEKHEHERLDRARQQMGAGPLIAL